MLRNSLKILPKWQSFAKLCHTANERYISSQSAAFDILLFGEIGFKQRIDFCKEANRPISILTVNSADVAEQHCSIKNIASILLKC